MNFRVNALQRFCKQPRQCPISIRIPVLNWRMAAKAGYLKKHIGIAPSVFNLVEI